MRRGAPPSLEYSGNHSLIVQFNVLSGGHLWKPRHKYNVAHERYVEARSGGGVDSPHEHIEFSWPTDFVRVICEREWGLCHADWLID